MDKKLKMGQYAIGDIVYDSPDDLRAEIVQLREGLLSYIEENKVFKGFITQIISQESGQALIEYLNNSFKKELINMNRLRQDDFKKLQRLRMSRRNYRR